MVDGCDHAGITLVHHEQLSSPAVSDDVVARVDALQFEYGQGPCVDAVRESEVVHSGDIARDGRWPVWGPRTASETGVRSMMCFRLFTSKDTIGALNLYADREAAFDDEDREHGLALAAHVALAIVASQQIETLHVGLDTRTTIGQATGMLMERFSLSPDVAFKVLKRVSQDSNRKLRDVALELVATGILPD